jgi:GNAT superfamily N-acetyltransferase
MHKLNQEQYPNAWPLFKDVPHSRTFVAALFEGNHKGHILADDPVHPTAAMLELICEFTFIGGATTNAAFNAEVRAHLQALLAGGKYVLLMPFNDTWRSLLREMVQGYKVLDIARSVFSIDAEGFAPHAGWRTHIPDGFTVKHYDRALVESASGVVDFWGSAEHFLSHGLGYAVLKGDEVISRCHTVLAGNRGMEISIETAEPYRRQGFAFLASCAFIEHCLQEDLRPDWSCWMVNEPSIRLAEKLGFRREADIPVIFASPK